MNRAVGALGQTLGYRSVGDREPQALHQPPLQELDQEELFVAVEMLSAVVLINRALEAGDASGFWNSLANPATGLAGVEGDSAQR